MDNDMAVNIYSKFSFSISSKENGQHDMAWKNNYAIPTQIGNECVHKS